MSRPGWLYQAVVVDLFSRQVVGWSMGSRIDTSLVLDALLMALWRSQPKQPVTVHSDQGSLSLNGAFCPTKLPLFHGLR